MSIEEFKKICIEYGYDVHIEVDTEIIRVSKHDFFSRRLPIKTIEEYLTRDFCEKLLSRFEVTILKNLFDVDLL
jgi:hypothetical protein